MAACVFLFFDRSKRPNCPRTSGEPVQITRRRNDRGNRSPDSVGSWRCGCGRRKRKPSLVLPSSRLSRPRRRRSQRRREWQPGRPVAVTSQLSQLPRLAMLTMRLWTGCRPAARPSALQCLHGSHLGKRDIRGTARECPSTAHIPNLRLLTVLCRSAHEDADEQRECVILVVRGPNYGQRETVASRSDMASATKVRIEGEADSLVGRAA